MHRAFCLAALAGCAAASPGLRATEPTHAATAADVERADVTFAGAGGVALYGQRWRPRTGAPRAVVVIHHGLADHSDRYAGFAERLARAGYAVWAFDMRGHGRSAGARQAIDRVDDMMDDLDAFVALARAGEPGLPVILYGHSLGGLATALDAIERQPPVAGVILAAPALAFAAPPVQAGAVRLFAPIAPDAPLLAVPHAQFSSDPKVVAELDHDPLIAQGNAPARTAGTAIDGVARVWAHPEALRVPLLVVHGAADEVTAPLGSRELVERAGTADRTLKLYPGLHHDVLHDPGGDRVAGDIVAWLDAHTGAQPAPATVELPAPLAAPTPSFLSVEMDVRGEHASGNSGATAGARVRFALGGPIGYAAGLDVRGGYFDGGHYELDGHLVGVAARLAGATILLTGGVGVGGFRSNSATHLPVELSLEAPLGPTRVLARVGLGWRLGGPQYADQVLGFADEATALVGVRLGRDLHYWDHVRAGAGPFLAGTYRNLGGTNVWGIAIGGEFWGGN
jgi:alpha-beta hydrolase superfamily lysophospholipase